MVTGIKNSTVVVVILIEDTKLHKRRITDGTSITDIYQRKVIVKSLKIQTNTHTHKKCRNIREKL